MKKSLGIALATLFLSAYVGAEAPAAAPYPGAKPEAEVTKMLKEQMHVNGQAYRTGDAVEKVAAFYRKQGLKEMPGTSKEGALFTKPGATITIQRPWMDMKTGQLIQDTLVTIAKQ
jgi:hypothetical protein